MRSRSLSPKVLSLPSRSTSTRINQSMADTSNPQIMSTRPTTDAGSKKQDPSSHHHHGRQSQQHSGARSKVGRPSSSKSSGAFVHHSGRRGRGHQSKSSAPAKEMMIPARRHEDDEVAVEIGSVYRVGSKKTQNLNHLLNFDYGPTRGVNDTRNAPRSGPKEPSRRRPPAAKYTKEHYLQANCQFLVRSERDYSTHIHDPDLPLAWEEIESVTLRTNDHPSCPICLYHPKAAKMTRCGHIYCWQCILHYLALSDEDWRKCPICDECISKQDLKSVVTVPFSEYGIGEDIEMNLMRRNRSSMFSFPLNKFDEEYEGKYPGLSQEYNSYSRIVTASPQEIVSHIIEKEKNTLLECYEFDKDEPESCFILEALNSLEERSKSLNLETEALKNLPSSLDILSLVGGAGNTASPPTFESMMRPDAEPFEPFSKAALPSSSNRKEFFNFYQSSDGQKIFLHGLNARMLERQFGDLKEGPITIRGNILEKEIVTVTEDLRSKFRYLRHLPLLCNIEFVELDLRSPCIEWNPSVLEEFGPQIEDRRRKRMRKARDERKREKRILIEENKLMGKYPDPRYRIESNYHFPDIGQDLVSGNISQTQNDNGVATFAKIIRKGNPGRSRQQAPRMSRSDTFPTASSSFTPPQRSVHESDDEDQPSCHIPDKPSLNLDLSTGVVVVKKGKKKSKNLVMLSSAPRPMI
eukprot:TRINITY_DN578_c0_g1_i3.p1 TRINITY_DN578_c0_g1~~TRINITY_DN578_c0_g1_i3.p1  ORF type:complete len:693 (+),score=164.74 TRINITY_DN578_c0_g1_i3:333-2411(+)